MDAKSGAKGDGDPIDVIELGETPLAIGTVIQAKILGSLELIDEGETDHKIIMIRSTDPHFSQVNNMADLEHFKPGITAKLDDWLISYKTSDGKPLNKLTSNTPTQPQEAAAVVEEVSRFYQQLIAQGGVNSHGYSLPGGASGPAPAQTAAGGSSPPVAVNPMQTLAEGW